MTEQEFKKLKNEILVELSTKISEVLEEKLKPFKEVLKIFTPNTFNKQPERFERNALGMIIKRKEVLGRDGLGRCVKRKEEIERDGFGRRINRRFVNIAG